MFADGDALLELIEKGDSIGFHMRGGYVHPSAISLGVKSGGAVKRVDIDAFLASFRPKKGGDDDDEEDEDASESEDPEGVDEESLEVQLEEPETEPDSEDVKPLKLKKPAAKALPESDPDADPEADSEEANESEDEPDVKQVVGSASDDDDEVAVTEVVGGDDSEQEPTPRRVTFDTSIPVRNDNISDEE